MTSTGYVVDADICTSDLLFDRDGKPITFNMFLELLRDSYYRRVKLSMIDTYIVSTIWLGLEHGRRNELPLIFETAVFDTDAGPKPLMIYRSATLEEALETHEHACMDVVAAFDITARKE